MFLQKLYNKNILKTSEQVEFLEQNIVFHAILIIVSKLLQPIICFWEKLFDFFFTGTREESARTFIVRA